MLALAARILYIYRSNLEKEIVNLTKDEIVRLTATVACAG